MFTSDNVPAHVPRTKARDWARVWGDVYEANMADGDKAREECEARAYRAANAILSDRSNALRVGDSVIWTSDKGARQRGRIKGFVDAEDEDKADGAPQMVEVEQWKSKRDGWVASGKIVKLAPADCHKTDMLWDPSRVTRKKDDMKTDIKALIGMMTDTTPSSSLKAVKRLGENTIGGYAIVFGDEDHRDVEDDFFTKATDIWADVYANQPVLFDHASGVELPDDPDLPADEQDNPRRYKIGEIVKRSTDDIGHFVEAVLDARNKWTQGIMELVDKGVLNFSSGSVPHLIKRAENGAVKSWPWIELSLTPTPAEPRNTNVRHLRSTEGIDASQDGTAAPEVYPDGDQTPMPSSTGARKQTNIKSSKKKGWNEMKNIHRRVNAFLTGYWDAEMAAQASALKSAHAAVKQEGENPEESPVVQEAASALEQLLQPIAEQAKSALGLDEEEVKAMLYKAALARVTKQDPMVEEEDYLEEGNPDEMPLDEYTDADDLMPEEDYMEQAPEELMDEEEVAATMSATRSADLDREINRRLNRMQEPRGRFATKSAPTVMRRTSTPELGLAAYIKACRDKDYSVLRPALARYKTAYKALGIDPDSAGGFLVAPEYSQEIIELLRAKSIFMRLDNVEGTGVAESLVTVMPMNSDTMYIPTQTGAATAYWTGENANITASQETLGQKQLVARKLAALVQVSNELLDDASPDVDAFIRDDISQQLSIAVDDAVLYGDGAAGEPLGIYNSADVTLTALNAALTYTALTQAIERVELADVPLDDSVRWIMNPRDKRVIRNLQDGAGQYIFANDALSAGIQMFPDLLLGYKWLATTRVHRTGTPEETDIFFGRFKDVVIGVRKSIEIVASDVAGTAFQADQTWVRAIMRLDIAMRHGESIEVLTDVRAS